MSSFRPLMVIGALVIIAGLLGVVSTEASLGSLLTVIIGLLACIASQLEAIWEAVRHEKNSLQDRDVPR